MRKWLVLIPVVAGLWLDLLDMTVVNVALPGIMTQLGSDIRTAQYVITGYLITVGVAEPVTAYLADTRGMKRIYLVSLVIFTAGSVLNAVAWNIDSLIAFRILQAIGGGMIMPVGLSIVKNTFNKKELPLAIAIMGVPIMIAPSLGPTIGGYFVQYWNWRWIFWLNLPIGVMAIIASLILLNEFATISKKLDIWGLLLIVVGISSLLLAISNGPTDGWTSAEIVSLFVVSGVTLPLFVIVEIYSKVPLLNMDIFKNRVYTASVFVSFFVFMAVFGSLFLVPIFMEQFKGIGAMKTGLILIPMLIGEGIFLPLSAVLTPRVGAMRVTIIGLIVMTIGAYPFINLQIGTSIENINLHLFLVGSGIGLALIPAMIMIYTVLPPSLVNQGSALFNMLRQIGSALGVAILTSVIQQRFPVHLQRLSEMVTPWSHIGQYISQLTNQIESIGYSHAQAYQASLAFIMDLVHRDAYISAFHDAFLASAIFSLIGIIPALFLFRGKGGPSVDDEL